MALKNPWEIASKPKQVPVYADGERIGTADRADVKLASFYGPIESVELTGLRDRPVPVGMLQRNYDVIVRDQKIEELEVEVERLKQSRREQAAKHKQKMSNLQKNFDDNVASQEKARLVKKENSNLKRENALKHEHNRELVAEVEKLQNDLKVANHNNQYWLQQEADRRTEVNKLVKDRADAEASSAFWHEKYLKTEEALSCLSESRKGLYNKSIDLSSDLVRLRSENKKLVDDYNKLNDDINCFMEDFSEGATAINRAVEDWNATVPE